MLIAAIVLFALAAVGGIILAMMHFQEKPMPVLLATGHGLLAASGLVLLLVAVLSMNLAGNARTALILFLIAALGGFLLLSYHLRAKRHPSALIVIHGGLAVIAFVLLLMGIMAMGT